MALIDAHGGRRSRDQLVGLLGPTAVEQGLADGAELTMIADQVVREDQLAPWTEAILAAAEAAPAEHVTAIAKTVVGGHEIFPVGGQWISPVVDTRSPH